MRLLAIIVWLALPFSSISQTDYMAHMKHYRDSINDEFGNPELSILEEQDQKDFKGLDFFEVDPAFVIKAKVKEIEDGTVFEMATSTERRPKYKPALKLSFEIEGKPLELTAYESVKLSQDPEYANYLFLPFTDLSNGDESYGGGRYLELDRSKMGDTAEIDFNKCYNPYCSYNSKYSCPVPPKENSLDVKIKAGVKAFGHH